MVQTQTKERPPAETLFEAATAAKPKPKNPRASTAVAVAPPQAAKPPAISQSVIGADGALQVLAIIANAAADPTCHPDKIRALLDMRKEIADEAARIAFIQAFVAMKKALPIINKDGKIVVLKKGADGQRVEGRDQVQQSTPYATFENISKVIDPILDAHGFALSFATEPSLDGARLHVIGRLDHIGGHGRTTTFPLPAEVSGSKNNVQGWGSSFSYGKRYGAIALLNIQTSAKEDADTDGTGPGGKIEAKNRKAAVKEAQQPDDSFPGDRVALITTKQQDDLRDAIEACGVGVERFCAHYKIAKVADLPAALYAEATRSCSNFAQAQKDKKTHG